MAFPTATDIRNFLEGYGITATQLSDTWVEDCIENRVVPFIERKIRSKLDTTESVTVYLNGNDSKALLLPTKCINSITDVQVLGNDYSSTYYITNYILDSRAGILRRNLAFPKGVENIVVTYVTGFSPIPENLNQAIIMLSAEHCLTVIGSRTGGGNKNIQSYGTSYGERGKYTEIRNDLTRLSIDILRQYMTGV